MCTVEDENNATTWFLPQERSPPSCDLSAPEEVAEGSSHFADKKCVTVVIRDTNLSRCHCGAPTHSMKYNFHTREDLIESKCDGSILLKTI